MRARISAAPRVERRAAYLESGSGSSTQHNKLAIALYLFTRKLSQPRFFACIIVLISLVVILTIPEDMDADDLARVLDSVDLQVVREQLESGELAQLQTVTNANPVSASHSAVEEAAATAQKPAGLEDLEEGEEDSDDAEVELVDDPSLQLADPRVAEAMRQAAEQRRRQRLEARKLRIRQQQQQRREAAEAEQEGRKEALSRLREALTAARASDPSAAAGDLGNPRLKPTDPTPTMEATPQPPAQPAASELANVTDTPPPPFSKGPGVPQEQDVARRLAKNKSELRFMQIKTRLTNMIQDFLFYKEEDEPKTTERTLDDGTKWIRKGSSWKMVEPEPLFDNAVQESDKAGKARHMKQKTNKLDFPVKMSRAEREFQKQLRKEAVKGLCLQSGPHDHKLRNKCHELGYATEAHMLHGEGGSLGLVANEARNQAAALREREMEYFETHTKPIQVEQRLWEKEQLDAQQAAEEIRKRRRDEDEAELLAFSESDLNQENGIKQAFKMLSRLASIEPEWKAFQDWSQPNTSSHQPDSNSNSHPVPRKGRLPDLDSLKSQMAALKVDLYTPYAPPSKFQKASKGEAHGQPSTTQHNQSIANSIPQDATPSTTQNHSMSRLRGAVMAEGDDSKNISTKDLNFLLKAAQESVDTLSKAENLGSQIKRMEDVHSMFAELKADATRAPFKLEKLVGRTEMKRHKERFRSELRQAEQDDALILAEAEANAMKDSEIVKNPDGTEGKHEDSGGGRHRKHRKEFHFDKHDAKAILKLQEEFQDEVRLRTVDS